MRCRSLSRTRRKPVTPDLKALAFVMVGLAMMCAATPALPAVRGRPLVAAAADTDTTVRRCRWLAVQQSGDTTTYAQVCATETWFRTHPDHVAWWRTVKLEPIPLQGEDSAR